MTLPPAITQALGWTLLHSLWQGALLALLLAFGLWLARTRSADLRYLLACGSLGLCLLGAALTYGLVYTPEALVDATLSDHVAEYGLIIDPGCPPAPQICGPLPAPTEIDSPPTPTGAFDLRVLTPLLPYLVAGWLLGVVLLSLRLVAHYLYAERYKRRHRRSLPAALQAVLEAHCGKMGIRQYVRALESSLTDSPLVIGVLKPVILIPTSALTGLTPHQLESILAHELAHIRRHDYLVNLLQSVAETLLFYHPAVWWISGRIRAEREHACDDLAVETSGTPLDYAQALTRLETLRRPELALAATGGNLATRIRRVIGVTPGADASSGLTGLGTLLLIVGFSLALSLPQWVAAQSRAAAPRPQLWATMYGLTARLTADATAPEEIPNSGYLTLEERAGDRQRTMTVTQARSGEFAYAYAVDGVPQEVDDEAMAWYHDAFARSLGIVYRTTPGDPNDLRYRSFVRNGEFTSFAHVYQRHLYYEIFDLASRRGEILYGGTVLTPDDPEFQAHAEESVLNEIGRVAHYAAHDLIANLPELGDTRVEEFIIDLLAHFTPTPRMNQALLELAGELRTDTRKAAVLTALAPVLPADARLASAYRAVAETLGDEALKSEVLRTAAHLP